MKAVNSALTSYIKSWLCKIQTNQSKLLNQSMLNGALMIEIVNNSFSKSKKNFGRLKK